MEKVWISVILQSGNSVRSSRLVMLRSSGLSSIKMKWGIPPSCDWSVRPLNRLLIEQHLSG
jgi:hypothetical protein